MTAWKRDTHYLATWAKFACMDFKEGVSYAMGLNDEATMESALI